MNTKRMLSSGLAVLMAMSMLAGCSANTAPGNSGSEAK